jgi:hypothetical protein
MDYLAAERAHSLERCGEVGHGEVGKGEAVSWARATLVYADRDLRVHGLPTLTLVPAPRLERRPKQLFPEASSPLRVVGRKLIRSGGVTIRTVVRMARAAFEASAPRVRPEVKSRGDPPRGYASGGATYLPREVFFGRLALAGAFFSVWGSDFGRFFPATSASFRLIGDRDRVTL